MLSLPRIVSIPKTMYAVPRPKNYQYQIFCNFRKNQVKKFSIRIVGLEPTFFLLESREIEEQATTISILFVGQVSFFHKLWYSTLRYQNLILCSRKLFFIFGSHEWGFHLVQKLLGNCELLADQTKQMILSRATLQPDKYSRYTRTIRVHI